MTKTNFYQYVPLEHEKFFLLQKLLEVARTQNMETAEGELTSVLIFVNAIDYVAKHLLSHLQKITHIITYKTSSARVFYEEPSKEINEPLGKLIQILNEYNFPDKVNFINKLKSFNKLRIKYLHKFMDLDENDIINNKVDKEIKQLCDEAEDIIESYDQIRLGIIKTWDDYKNSFAPVQNIPQIQQTKESSNTIYPPKQSN